MGLPEVLGDKSMFCGVFRKFVPNPEALKAPLPLLPRANWDLGVWQYRLWSLQGKDTKSERFLAENQLSSNESLSFANWYNGEVSKSAKI
jgi:hypothetical protein